jgi:hypothetical protein
MDFPESAYTKAPEGLNIPLEPSFATFLKLLLL